ncbi:threonine/serine exporter family protein [Dysosmobacter sp.]|uniref:threonine/serine exporter family protein n=1 Tax=Dysosmobacter sp. TaxID=2591382 RepID=UPI002A8A2E05|nr:threonine/serine exporter family protein [Dysosmobacter sp.]MDY3985717.1 threonine/serine exporter family protein [Dysosmobacter sp.]
MERFLPCLYAVLACGGFCLIFEVKKPLFVLLCSLNGGVSWLVYLLLEGVCPQATRYLIATIVVSVLAELMARVLKAPATIFLIVGIIPLVPGGGLYYTMEALLSGDTALFARTALETAACAGAIAVGVSMVSSLARLLFRKHLVEGRQP